MFELLLGQAYAEAVFDLRDDADHVDGVEAQALKQIGAVFEVLMFFPGVRFEKLNESLANDLAVRHGSPSWQVEIPEKLGQSAALIYVKKTIFAEFGKSAWVQDRE